MTEVGRHRDVPDDLPSDWRGEVFLVGLGVAFGVALGLGLWFLVLGGTTY